jgi:hypothetical protein
MSKSNPRGTIEQRMARGSTPDEHGCVIWHRARNNRGYGVTYLDGKVRLAHRVAWYLEHGSWPVDGLVVDHICEVKACVNVRHLRLLTSGENILRSPRSPMNVKLARTACGRGHEYTPETLRIDSKGHRQCRTCAEIRAGGGRHRMV